MALTLAPQPRSGSKGYYRGTHRACPPEETWSRIVPLLHDAGVSRVGELTRLDDAGIPVFQAVRPRSRTLAVTLGAGLTPVQARVAAAMASLELWHAEHVDAPPSWSAVGAVRANLGYNPYALPLRAHHMLNDGMVLDWVPATLLTNGRPTMVPRPCAEYDLRLREEWSPPVFGPSAAGLAAGNTHAEAVLHALYEVLARDAVAASRALPAAERVRVDPTGVDDADARRLIERLDGAGASLAILDITGPTGVPAFEVVAAAPGQAAPARGAAAHLDRDAALCHALAAVARERLALITGVRDDMPDNPAMRAAAAAPAPFPSGGRTRAYQDIPSTSTTSFVGDVAEIADRIRRSGAGPALVVDLTRPSIGLPVARVIVPGLRHLDER